MKDLFLSGVAMFAMCRWQHTALMRAIAAMNAG